MTMTAKEAAKELLDSAALSDAAAEQLSTHRNSLGKAGAARYRQHAAACRMGAAALAAASAAPRSLHGNCSRPDSARRAAERAVSKALKNELEGGE